MLSTKDPKMVFTSKTTSIELKLSVKLLNDEVAVTIITIKDIKKKINILIWSFN